MTFLSFQYLVREHRKNSQHLTKMPITFDTVAQIQQKNNIFLDSSHQYLSNDIYFVWFHGDPNFAIIFGSDVICYCWASKSAYFVEHTLSYQS